MRKSSLKLIVGSASVAIAPLLLEHNFASAQPNQPQSAGLSGSYLGVMVDPSEAFGLGQNYLKQTGSPANWFIDQALQGSSLTAQPNNSAQSQSVDPRGFQGRIDLTGSPISVRGKVTLGAEETTVQPIVSYDLAIARNANIYAGAGYSFVNSTGKTPVPNNQNSFFVTAGAEAAVSDKVVVYGDAQYPVDQANFKITSPTKVQVGIGFRF